MTTDSLSHFVNTTIGLMVFYCFLCVLFLLVYSYLFYDFGILCWSQIQGYILVYVVCFIDIIGGYLGVQALKKGPDSFYSDYTPAMTLLISSVFINLFAYVAFVNSLYRDKMLIYLEEYFGRYDDVPEILRDLQSTTSCCGILGYKDYPTFSNVSGTYYKVSTSCCVQVQEGCNIFSNKSLSTINETIFTTACTRDYIPQPPHRPDAVTEAFIMKFTQKAQLVYCCPYILLFLKLILLGFYRHSMLDNIISDIPTITVNYDADEEEPHILIEKITLDGPDSDSSTVTSNVQVALEVEDINRKSMSSMGSTKTRQKRRRRSRRDRNASSGSVLEEDYKERKSRKSSALPPQGLEEDKERKPRKSLAQGLEEDKERKPRKSSPQEQDVPPSTLQKALSLAATSSVAVSNVPPSPSVMNVSKKEQK